MSDKPTFDEQLATFCREYTHSDGEKGLPPYLAAGNWAREYTQREVWASPIVATLLGVQAERDELRRELDHALETLGQKAKEWATGDAAERVKGERDGLRAELKECEITIKKLDEACDNLLKQRRQLREELADLRRVSHGLSVALNGCLVALRMGTLVDEQAAIDYGMEALADYERQVVGEL